MQIAEAIDLLGDVTMLWSNVIASPHEPAALSSPPDLSSPIVTTLTKKDVARRVAELTGEPIYRCEPWVTRVIESMSDLMMNADPEVRIELRDFGVFEVKKTKAKPKARNPKTNETVFIPSRRKTHFKPSKKLKAVLQAPLLDRINESTGDGDAAAVAALVAPVAAQAPSVQALA